LVFKGSLGHHGDPVLDIARQTQCQHPAIGRFC
jgi:hypothetical protein